jgi:hypothetical protein
MQVSEVQLSLLALAESRKPLSSEIAWSKHNHLAKRCTFGGYNLLCQIQ